jgi:hypothetical protein
MGFVWFFDIQANMPEQTLNALSYWGDQVIQAVAYVSDALTLPLSGKAEWWETGVSFYTNAKAWIAQDANSRVPSRYMGDFDSLEGRATLWFLKYIGAPGHCDFYVGVDAFGVLVYKVENFAYRTFVHLKIEAGACKTVPDITVA